MQQAILHGQDGYMEKDQPPILHGQTGFIMVSGVPRHFNPFTKWPAVSLGTYL
jgi:hypothetical protein